MARTMTMPTLVVARLARTALVTATRVPHDPRSSAATFTNPTSSAMYYSSIQPPQLDEIAGRRVLGAAPTRPKVAYEQTVIVPSSGFWMVVRTPQRSVVREIVASIQEVPRGFTIVPPCRGQRLRDASAELIAAGLKPVTTRRRRCPRGLASRR